MAQPLNEIQQGRFNMLPHQAVMAVGAEAQTEVLRRTLQSLNFVQMKPVKTTQEVDLAAPFLVAMVDFANVAALQGIVKFFSDLKGFVGAKVLFATNPVQLSDEELFFGVELDSKRTFYGARRDEELRAFIKQRALETADTGSMSHVEVEVLKAIRRHDHSALGLWQERLQVMSKTSEDVNRLLALICEEKKDFKRMVFHLKQTLAANPQNLWAANKLGHHFLRNKQVSEGTEILKRLSRFHELNADRLFTLGNAYLNAGKTQDAETILNKGAQLTSGKDERFTEGLAKVDAMKGDTAKALEKLGRKYLSIDVLSFLNTRAVMAVRNGAVQDGAQLYQQAINGCDPEQVLILARILFNQGLAYVRSERPELAEAAFQKSTELGGAAFNRAAKPLTITRQLIAKQQRQRAQAGSSAPLESVASAMDEFEYEKFA